MKQETEWTTLLWEGWAALVLCTAAVFCPGSPALRYPAVLWPGLALAGVVPLAWAGWWLGAKRPGPLPPEQPLELPGRVHITREELVALA